MQLPEELSQTDRLELQVVHEREARLAIEIELATVRLQALKKDHVQASNARTVVHQRIRESYQINERDTVDFETGKISRVEVLKSA